MKKKQAWYIGAFALPVFLWVIIYALWRQFPFGKNTLLIWDMKWQYTAFFCHLRNILHGQASGVYSFSRAIGGEMPGVLAYYLLSPFNLLIYFFDRKNIYIGIMIIALCKTGASGLTMYTFLAGRKAGYGALLFSCAYALNAYVVGYQFNIFWMDALIILPLMVWGIEKLVDEGKDILYICMVALAVITNFYTGYMICIFSVLYFWCYLLLISGHKCRLREILRYHAASLMGGMLAAGVALPVFFALNGGKTDSDLQKVLSDKTVLLGYSDLIRAIFCGEINEGQMTAGKPLLYGSVLAFVFVVYYFIFSKEAIKSKIAYTLLFAVFAVSFKYNNLNCLWHGMQPPMGSPYRFSFLFIFLLIELAYQGFIVWEEKQEKEKKTGKVIYAAVLVLLFFAGYRTLHEAGFWLNFLLTGIYVLLMIVVHRKGRILFLCVLAPELILNAGTLYLNSAAYQAAATTDEWNSYIDRTGPLIEQVKQDKDFFRTVLTGDARFANNDGLLWNVYALESYTSLEKSTTQLLAKNMGYRYSIKYGMSYGTGADSVSDALLGVRYLISSEQYGAPYEEVYEENGLTVWKNRAEFPIAYLMDESVLEIEPEKLSLFDYENELLHSLSVGYDEDVFSVGSLEMNDIRNAVPDEEGKYVRENESEEAYIEYCIKVSEKGCAYLQDDLSGVTKDWYKGKDTCLEDGMHGVSTVKMILNGKEQDLSGQRDGVKKLGELTPEDQVYVRFYPGEDEAFRGETVALAVERTDVLETYAKMVQAQKVDVRMKKEQDIVIQCTNDAKEDRYLMLSIPYDTGWHVSVDGEQTEIIENDHQMLIIPVKPGEHSIEIRYIPRGLYMGIFISVIALGMMIWKIKKNLDITTLPC